MVTIQQLRKQGLTKKQVARKLGVHRNTVAKYWDDPLKESTEINGKSSIIDPYKPFLKHRLGNYPELTASRLHREITKFEVPANDGTELLPEEPFEGSKRTTRRAVARLRPNPQRVYKPFETLPGQQFQVDWAGPWKIGCGEDKKKIWLFTMVLGYSRALYARFVDGVDMVNFLECHKRGFEYLGGIPQEGIYDNCKTVVSDRVGAVIQFNRDFMRFALQYGFTPEACWVGDPESKGKVERKIDYVQTDFLYSRPLEETTLCELNNEVLRWLDEVANERKHQTINERPADRLAEEQAALGPLPRREIEIFEMVSRKVQKNGLFSFENNKYSVPSEYARSTVDIQVHRDQLKVFARDELIAEHQRCHKRGQLVPKDGHWQDRSTGPGGHKSKRQKEFEELGGEAASFMKQMARQRTGTLSEQVDEILGLREDYETEQIREALQRAGSFGNYSSQAVRKILETQQQDPEALPEDPREEKGRGRYTGPNINVQRRSPEEYGQRAGVKVQ